MSRLPRLGPLLTRWRDEALITLLLAGLAYALAAGSLTWRFDRLLYDFGLSAWTREAPDDIVIVAIDDASLDAIGRWPWKRSVHATLLRELALVKPRAVLLDLVLSEPDLDLEQDRLLADALRQAAPVVVPVPWQAVSGGLIALEPVEPLRSAVLLGAAEAAVDADGVLRHAFLRAGPGTTDYPHAALALLRAGGQAPPPGLAVENQAAGDLAPGGPGQRSGAFLIRYTGPPGHLQRVSYVDLLRGAVPVGWLADRYVFIGMTAKGLGDTLATPVNGSNAAMPGIEVLANVFQTLRRGDAVAEVSPQRAGLLAATLLVLLMLGFAVAGTRVALALALISVPATALASLLALGAGWWWSPVPYSMAAVLAYPLWSWRRLERAVASLDREIMRVNAEPGLYGPLPTSGRWRPSPRDRLASRVGTLGVATDTVRSARRFLADALAGLPTAMLVTDVQGRVLMANPLAAGLFELDSPAQLQGLDLPAMLEEFRTSQPIDWPALFSRARVSAAPLAVEAQLVRLSDFMIHLAGVEMLGQARWVVTMADVGPIKRAQRRRDELLAFVSHDLRSPANAIVMLADMHQRGLMSTPQPELLAEVRRLASRTLQLSEDFVRSAQAESRPLTLVMAGLQPLVEEAVVDLRAQAVSAGVSLHVAVDAGLQWRVDVSLVARAVGNLVSNAVKHSPAGASVEVDAERVGAELRLRVRDHGPGMTVAQLQQLELGDQGVVTTDAQGVGFGLLFVQRVAQRHGGELRAWLAASGSGMVFELRLSALP